MVGDDADGGDDDDTVHGESTMSDHCCPFQMFTRETHSKNEINIIPSAKSCLLACCCFLPAAAAAAAANGDESSFVRFEKMRCLRCDGRWPSEKHCVRRQAQDLLAGSSRSTRRRLWVTCSEKVAGCWCIDPAILKLLLPANRARNQPEERRV